MRKIINLNHSTCDYECMWNGIEDLYRNKKAEDFPGFFFFCLSGIGNFVYQKSSLGQPKRLASWNDGRTKQMYRSISELIGFRFKHIEGRSFDYAMEKAKEQIMLEKPVVLGCLDMYYLSYYPKFFGQQHIPIHYVLMVGFDEEKGCAYLLDCGVKEVQEMSFAQLQKALDITKTPLSDKNTVCTIDFKETLKPVIEIAREGFYKKAKAVLEPSVGFIGIPGMHKLAKEFEHWQKELTQEEYEDSLRSLVMFTGTVPALPSRLIGIEKDNILHMADREKLTEVFRWLGDTYGISAWNRAAEEFLESGLLIEKLTNQIVEYLLKERSGLDELPDSIRQIAEMEEKAFRSVLLGTESNS
jgi:hypothetical protein